MSLRRVEKTTQKRELAVSSCAWQRFSVGSGRLRFHLDLIGSSSRLQERHRSLRLRHRERRPGGRRRAADAGRPDPVGERRGREVGHSGGHGGAPQGRKRLTIPFIGMARCQNGGLCRSAAWAPSGWRWVGSRPDPSTRREGFPRAARYGTPEGRTRWENSGFFGFFRAKPAAPRPPPSPAPIPETFLTTPTE